MKLFMLALTVLVFSSCARYQKFENGWDKFWSIGEYSPAAIQAKNDQIRLDNYRDKLTEEVHLGIITQSEAQRDLLEYENSIRHQRINEILALAQIYEMRNSALMQAGRQINEAMNPRRRSYSESTGHNLVAASYSQPIRCQTNEYAGTIYTDCS